MTLSDELFGKSEQLPRERVTRTYTFREVTAWVLVGMLAIAYLSKPEAPRTSDVVVTPRLFLDYTQRVGAVQAELKQLRREFEALPRTGLSPMRLPDVSAGKEVLR